MEDVTDWGPDINENVFSRDVVFNEGSIKKIKTVKKIIIIEIILKTKYTKNQKLKKVINQKFKSVRKIKMSAKLNDYKGYSAYCMLTS